MPFQPLAGQELTIDGATYRVAEHPNAPGMPYGQEGRRAVVYQLAAEGGDRSALKVFKPRFSVPRMVAVAERLRPYGRLPGLQVCERTVLTATRHRETLAQHPDLAYAVLMPWMDGSTWQEIVLSATDPAWSPITAEESLRLARGLAEALVALEERGLAHCDLSGPNLIVGANYRVALVDLEEMYGPGFVQPKILPAGSPGYAHKSAPHGLWNDDADRFSGAVLLAEMLGWSDFQVRQTAWGESYFPPDEIQRPGKRYTVLRDRLEARWGRRLADLYSRAWNSDSLADCPTFAAWLVTLPTEVPAVPEDAPTVTAIPAGPAPRVADSSGLLILKAQGAADAGDTEQAIALYQEAMPGVTREMAGLIQSRIDVLKEVRDRVKAPPSGWLCPNCGERVSQEMQICPHCEQVPQPAEPPPVGWLCANCGKRVAGDQAICPYCEGVPLQPKEAAPPDVERGVRRDLEPVRVQPTVEEPAVQTKPESVAIATEGGRTLAGLPWLSLLALALVWGFGLVFVLGSFSVYRGLGAILSALLGVLVLGGTLWLYLGQLELRAPWKRVLLLAFAVGTAAGLLSTVALVAVGYALNLSFLIQRVWGLPVAPFWVGAVLGTAVMGTRTARTTQPSRAPSRVPLAVMSVLTLILLIAVSRWWGESLPSAATAPLPVEMEPVPAGPFDMGSKGGDPDERTVHPVMLDAYRIDRYEATNAEYAAFLNTEGNQIEWFAHWYNSDSDNRRIFHHDGEWFVSRGYGNHPVGGVSWYGARAYCAWRNGQLPSEAQWEKAARGTDGRIFPWGDEIDCNQANTSDCGGDPSAVGAHPAGASPYGALDMAGNAWEWVSDWYDQDFYSLLAARSLNPTGPSAGTRKGIRGGSFMTSHSLARSSNRLGEYPGTRHPSIGFRCVMLDPIEG